MDEKVKGIQLHPDTFRGMARLSHEQRGVLLLALMADAGFCEPPEMDFPTSLVFDMVIPSVHKAQENYLRQYKANVENGKKGGRPKKNPSDTDKTDGINEKPMGFSENQSDTEENPKKQNRIEENRKESNTSISLHSNEVFTTSTLSAKSAAETVIKGKKKTIKGKRADTFERFWEAFGYKKDRAQAVDAWAAIPSLTDALVDRICDAARREAENRPELESKGRSPQYAQGWLNGRRWEDEPEEPAFTLINPRRGRNA